MSSIKWTAVGTAIAAVTAIALGGISASEGQKKAEVVGQKTEKETVRSKNMRTIAREIISNNRDGVEQYPSYRFDRPLNINTPVPDLKNHRLTSFFDAKTGLYVFIGEVDGVMRVISIYSKAEVQTAIDLLTTQEKKQ